MSTSFFPPAPTDTTNNPFEPENFRIDSGKWKEVDLGNDLRVKVNPEGDITEILTGDCAGEQYFGFSAMVRETAKAGKKVPTNEQWESIISSINPTLDLKKGWQDDVSVGEALGLNLAGYRNYVFTEYRYQGAAGYYWSSSPFGEHGSYVVLSSTQVYPLIGGVRAYGFSVRCLKD